MKKNTKETISTLMSMSVYFKGHFLPVSVRWKIDYYLIDCFQQTFLISSFKTISMFLSTLCRFLKSAVM